MQQIVITMADDGRITVEVDGQEPYVCESADECLAYLAQLMGGESAEEAGEGEEPDVATMWNEEAAKRQPMGM